MITKQEYLKENWKYSIIFNIPTAFGLIILTSHIIKDIPFRIMTIFFFFVYFVFSTLSKWYDEDRIRELENNMKKMRNEKVIEWWDSLDPNKQQELLIKYRSKPKTPNSIDEFYKQSNLTDIKERSVAVISLDTQDFNLWKLDSNLKHNGINTPTKFKVENTTYRCVTNICDLCSINIDEIVETKKAKENKHYEEIKFILKSNMSND
jgi:hypothetical protein